MTDARSTGAAETEAHTAAALAARCPGLIDLLGPNLAGALEGFTSPEERDTSSEGSDGAEDGADGAAAAAAAVDDGDGEDRGYWLRVELMFALRLLMLRATKEISSALLVAGDESSSSSSPDDPGDGSGNEKLASAASAAAASAESGDSSRLRFLREHLGQLGDVLAAVEVSLQVAAEEGEAMQDSSSNRGDENADGGKSAGRPIFVRLVESYDLTPTDALALQFVVTLKIHRSSCLRSLLTSQSDIDKPLIDECSGSLIQYACGLSQLQLAPLKDDAHPLVTDRVLEATEDDLLGSGHKFSAPDEVCRALMGRTLDEEDRLKLSGTPLLSIVDEDCGAGGNDDARDRASDGADRGQQIQGGEKATAETVQKMLRDLDVAASEEGEGSGSETSFDEVDRDEVEEDARGAAADADVEGEEEGASDVGVGATDALALPVTAPDDRDPRTYTCELEYLNDQFHLVMKQIECANHRHARELKDAAVETQPRWMRSGENSGKKSSMGELTAKLRLARRKIEMSLELTRKAGIFYPRLEVLVRQLGLDNFEKSVVLYLCGSMISPIFKSSIANDSYRGSARKCTVGDLLLVFCDTVSEQVQARTYFYRSSRLVSRGLVRVCSTYGAADLTDQELKLDRRVLDCIVGLDKESTEVAQGSHLYDPRVDFDTVVLSPGLKDGILGSVMNFDRFQTYRRRAPGIDDAIAYGKGLTLMFCGPSGTGKTMTANAIAARAGKKLLLVDLPRLAVADKNGEEGSRFQSIFREAELSNAIIFFDECEMLFAKRDSGSSQVTELLTELERFEGIVFLATNRPFDLDEAMYRRISEVFEFKPPNHVERLEIWRLITAHEAVPCDEDVDWEAIALQYELTGGFIKNAVLAALLVAVGRCSDAPVVRESDIIDGCKKQMRGALQMQDFDERKVPTSGLDDLIISNSARQQLKDMVDIEKARGILFGTWGFDEQMRDRQGTTALFWGPRGTGRSRAAEAIGYELGKPLKVIDFPQLLGRTGRANATAVRDVFKEARLMDAVLVLGGLSVDADCGAASADDTRLLNLVVREMTRFPGVVIMLVDTENSLDLFISRLEKGLLNGIKFSVQFDLPNIRNRECLWKKMLPSSVPGYDSIDFGGLAKASDKFNFVQIANSVYRAAAAAALRHEKKRCVNMSDFKAAIDDERKRGESSVDRWVKSQYL